MRRAYRLKRNEEQEDSAFVSMTDMTVSFLFIVMILLAFFASQYSEDAVPESVYLETLRELHATQARLDAAQETLKQVRQLLADAREENRVLLIEIQRLIAKVKELEKQLEESRRVDPLEQYLAATANERRRILEALQRELQVDFPDLKVVISQESDALRFEGDGLFRSGASDLRQDRRAIVEKIATRLEEILPCYTLGPRAQWSADCNAGNAVIEAVQIEGHTDTDGSEINNLILSTARANTTFIVMTEKEPGLVQHHNFRGQPVMSVAGYGEMRPVTGNETPEQKATNRRIDLRIIMYTPSRSDEIVRIQKALKGQLESEDAP